MPPRKSRARADAAEPPAAKKAKTAATNVGGHLPTVAPSGELEAAAGPTLSQDAANTLDGDDPGTSAVNPKPARKATKAVAKKPLHAESDLQRAYLQGAIAFEAHVDNSVRSSTFTIIDDGWIEEKNTPRELTPIERAHWTREDEHELRLKWEDDPLHVQIMAETDSTLKEHRVVWKLCCQYFRCLPVDIIGDAVIGSEHRLAIDQTGQKKIPARHIASLPYSPFWPSTACNALSDILWHPLWKNGHVGSLVLAIQFAVIARTNDKRTWEFQNPTDSRFIDDLREAIDAERGLYDYERNSVGELCRRVHAKNPTKQISDWFLLFNGIYKLYGGSGKKPTTAVYAVATEDLVAIKTALRDLGGYDLPTPATIDMYRAAFSVDRTATSAPQGVPRFKAILDTVALNYKRRQLVHQRVKNAAANPDPDAPDAEMSLAAPEPAEASPEPGPEPDATPILADQVLHTSDAELPLAAQAEARLTPVPTLCSEPAPVPMNTLGASESTGVPGSQVPLASGPASAARPSPMPPRPTTSAVEDVGPAGAMGALPLSTTSSSRQWGVRPARRPAPPSS